MNVQGAAAKALRRLQGAGLVAGIDVGQRRDECALVVADHRTRRAGAATEHRWRVVDAWAAPLGTRSPDASVLIADRLGRQTGPVAVVIDATGAGDLWVDSLVAVGVVPALSVVVTAAGSSSRWSVDQVGSHEIARVTAPRHPGGNGDTVSILGALESAMSVPPGAVRPAVSVDPTVTASEAGTALRAQLGGLSWQRGRPDHDDGAHDDLAFALALALWASASTPGAMKRQQRSTFHSVAARWLDEGPQSRIVDGTRPSYAARRAAALRHHGNGGFF